MVKKNFDGEMNRGFLQLVVLLMVEKEAYGYQLLKSIEDLDYNVEENTLYPLLRRLEKKGYVKSKWEVASDRPRKYYVITEEGKVIRGRLVAQWKLQNNVIVQLMEGKDSV